MLRYVLTGAPGAGKTTLLRALRERGYPVVAEAATDVVIREQSLGHDEPWLGAGFVDAITLLQRERQQRAVGSATEVGVFDRSPICTVALAHQLGRAVTPTLAREVDRIVREGVYQRRVFFVRLLGFVTPTAVRRISFAESIQFERRHEQAYRDHGFELVDVPAEPVGKRADLVEERIRAWGGRAPSGPGRRRRLGR